ncbi:MAG: lipid-A-disaccharide synthase [Methylophilus sp.]|uniref:lipid-A-disaccharide synthase n=1 Tax=Methylophilus sp. TaxID=29541 RepID=UPI002B6C2778|nr:lipid-A-disaccharide synthase [Methylophilus sp.]HSH86308.1 lipid-A-disaccharide synthase [Methylophilus sp.]
MAKIAMVAGEASGDLLGYHLIQELKSLHPDIQIFGIAGPKMMSLGAKSLYPIERLSVRGYLEVLKHLWGLLKLRKELLRQILLQKPDVFIGIDAPDFNFWLEKKLKAKGIATIHYVSPSIWAWRKNRIHSIKRAVSHILALFPFEPALYQQIGVPVTYIGHPLADALPMEPDVPQMREKLKLKKNSVVIALLPGSRQSEVIFHAELMLETAISFERLMRENGNAVQFLVPLVTRETRDIFQNAWHQLLTQQPDIKIDMQIMFGHAHEAMIAADAIVVASGTATLEAALLKKPMVITYKMSNMSWQLLKRMRLQPYVGLPNILAGEFIVPELLQKDANPEQIAQTLYNLLADKTGLATLREKYRAIHMQLKQNSAQKAAAVIKQFLPAA